MDDQNKIQGQAQSQPQSQPGAVGFLKEQAPRTQHTETGVPKFIEPSGAEREIEVPPRLKEIGVRPAAPEFPKVGPSEQKLGISPTGASVPVKTEPSGLVQVPMTEEEAKQTFKNEKPTASVKWRAANVIKYFKKMHRKLLTRKN